MKANNNMVRIKFKHVISDPDRHGNERFYFRPKGHRKIRLRGVFGSDEFMEAYRNAFAGLSEQKPKTIGQSRKGSFGHVCAAYYSSPVFERLNKSTQSWRRRSLDLICERHGDKPVAMMRAKHVRMLRDELTKFPGASRSRLKALKALFRWAIEEELAQNDPTIGVKPISYVSKPHHTWTLEEVEQYERHHPVGTKARLALALLLYTSWRRGDAPRLGPQHIYEDRKPDGTKEKRIKYRLDKNEHRNPSDMDIPLWHELAEIIEATPSGHLSFLTTQYGKPHTKFGFGEKFKNWCRQANLPHCSCHGLRSAAACRLAERGATVFEIMAITGHKSPVEVERYTRAVRQKKLADSAYDKLK